MYGVEWRLVANEFVAAPSLSEEMQAGGPETGEWGGLVSLVYEGADPSHLEVALPCLSRHGLSGTFFLEPTAMLDRAAEWSAAANEGHEMGCACLFGADDGKGNLLHWTLENVELEIRENRRLLTETFPRQSDFAFLYPGPEMGCLTTAYNPKPTEYRPTIERAFAFAVSAGQGLNDYRDADLSHLRRIDTESLDAGALIDICKEAEASRRWAILCFKGVGVGEAGTDALAHEKLCRHLSGSGPVTATVLKTCYRIRSAREAPEHSLYLRES